MYVQDELRGQAGQKRCDIGEKQERSGREEEGGVGADDEVKRRTVHGEHGDRDNARTRAGEREKRGSEGEQEREDGRRARAQHRHVGLVRDGAFTGMPASPHARAKT